MISGQTWYMLQCIKHFDTLHVPPSPVDGFRSDLAHVYNIIGVVLIADYSLMILTLFSRSPWDLHY